MPKVKDKERILKPAREKDTSYLQGSCQLISQNKFCSIEIFKFFAMDWQEILKVMKNGDLQPRLLYPAKLSFGIEGQTELPS